MPAPLPFRDGLIDATALVRNLEVVTRNLADFQASGVKRLNPWQLRCSSGPPRSASGLEACPAATIRTRDAWLLETARAVLLIRLLPRKR